MFSADFKTLKKKKTHSYPCLQTLWWVYNKRRVKLLSLVFDSSTTFEAEIGQLASFRTFKETLKDYREKFRSTVLLNSILIIQISESYIGRSELDGF